MKSAIISVGAGVTVFLLCYFVLPSPVTYVSRPEPCKSEQCTADIQQPREDTYWVWFAPFGGAYEQQNRYRGLDHKSSEIERFILNPLTYSIFLGAISSLLVFVGTKHWTKK